MGTFVRGMKQLQVDPKEISLILLTHGHWDHIACLSGIRELSGALSPFTIGIRPGWKPDGQRFRQGSHPMAGV